MLMRVSKWSLGGDVCRAISEAKCAMLTGDARLHQGRELSRLITIARGAKFYEHQAGEDRDEGAGKRRVVLYVESGQIKRVFFSEGHYSHGTWYEVADF